MKEYKIISKYSIDELSEEVNALLKKEGWEPTGGVFVYRQNFEDFFCQAICRNLTPTNWR